MRKSTIEAIQEIANQRDRKCLSPEYFNNRTNLKWQCKEEHIWEATPNNITHLMNHTKMMNFKK